MCILSIKCYIIPNPPFQSPGQLLVMLSVSSNVDFGDTRKVSLIGTFIDMNVSWQYKYLCSENRTEQTIGDSWPDGRDIMSPMINGCPKLLWRNRSSIWWCSEPDVLHHPDDIWEGFTKGFVWWMAINHHRYKWNRTASTVI